MTLHSLDSDSPKLLEVHRFTGGPFQENAYLVRCTTTSEVVVIDPGAAAPEMVSLLKDTGWPVRAVYLTHAHIDHVEGIPAIRRFTEAPIYLHPLDHVIYDHAQESAAMFGLVMDRPLPPPDAPLVPGEFVPVGAQELEVRFAPGHAPGHVMFHSRSEGFALVGDVIFKASIGRTDLPGGDFQELMQSIREQVLSLPDDTRLLPGHGDSTTVKDERRGNPFLISQVPGGFA